MGALVWLFTRAWRHRRALGAGLAVLAAVGLAWWTYSAIRAAGAAEARVKAVAKIEAAELRAERAEVALELAEARFEAVAYVVERRNDINEEVARGTAEIEAAAGREAVLAAWALAVRRVRDDAARARAAHLGGSG